MEPEKVSFGRWLDIWVNEFCGSVKPRTRELYRGTVDNRIKPALGAVRLTALTTAMIQRFYNDSMEGDRAVSAKTVKNFHGIIHKALNQAMEAGYIRFNPAAACKLPRVEKAEIKPLNREQMGAFLRTIEGNPFEALFQVTIFTGMREGEVLGLPWASVDFERGTILLKQQLQSIRGVYQIVPLKNDRSRLITPAPFVMELLRRQKIKQAEQQLQTGPLWEDSGLVFTNQAGGHLARTTVYHHFKRVAASIGMPDARFHDLRHTYAVSSLEAGDDVKTVQENLGHATASFTLDVYGHVSERMKQESANRMEQLIQSLKG